MSLFDCYLTLMWAGYRKCDWKKDGEMMHIMSWIWFICYLEITQTPKSSTLEMFLVGIPMVFNVVIISPHGYYFGQANALGIPGMTLVDK